MESIGTSILGSTVSKMMSDTFPFISFPTRHWLCFFFLPLWQDT